MANLVRMFHARVVEQLMDCHVALLEVEHVSQTVPNSDQSINQKLICMSNADENQKSWITIFHIYCTLTKVYNWFPVL